MYNIDVNPGTCLDFQLHKLVSDAADERVQIRGELADVVVFLCFTVQDGRLHMRTI
jgi:hypothetical protein